MEKEKMIKSSFKLLCELTINIKIHVPTAIIVSIVWILALYIYDCGLKKQHYIKKPVIDRFYGDFIVR